MDHDSNHLDTPLLFDPEACPTDRLAMHIGDAPLTFGSRLYILAYIRRCSMKTAKIFRSGNSQAVRIPKEFQMEGSEVEIMKSGSSLVLRPCKKSWAPLFDSLDKFTDDFMKDGRKQPRTQTRQKAF
jgi:antitoxin VapB